VIKKEFIMKIQILGTGCAKCKSLYENTKKAINTAGISAEIEKIEDIKEIMKFNVMVTPALVIDGEVKSAGKLLSPEDIKKLLV
jgi:small redox-active disulfide protein 2